MKHMDLRFYWLRDMVNKKVLQVEYVPTTLQPADLLTKALPKDAIVAHRTTMGLI